MSNAFTVNGVVGLEATITIPRVGIWHGDIVVDDETGTQVSAGPVSIVLGGITISCFAIRGGAWRGKTRLRVKGGAGGISKRLPSRSYRDIPAAQVVKDILAACGETLSPTANVPGLFTHWTTAGEESGGQQLAAIVAELGLSWRILLDGTVWLGLETWPLSTQVDYLIMDRRPEDDWMRIGPDAPTVYPGTVFEGGRVDRVVHSIRAEAVRTEVWFGSTNRIAANLDSASRAGAPEIDYHALYACKVVSQNADGSLELQPDSPRMSGVSAVKIRIGVPGVTVEVPQGAQVLLGFENGDPARPYASLFDAGSVTSVTIKATKVVIDSNDISLAGGGAPIARQGDPITIILPFTIVPGNPASTLPVPFPIAGTILSGNAGVKA